MTNAEFEQLESRLAKGGLQAEVGWTRGGYIRLTVTKATAAEYTCEAAIMKRAAQILGMGPTCFHIVKVKNRATKKYNK